MLPGSQATLHFVRPQREKNLGNKADFLVKEQSGWDVMPVFRGLASPNPPEPSRNEREEVREDGQAWG
ncbi:hypothetical protein NMY22_g15131 [Coprinellus aureogranulatus]|nr:hypothetical protein NMY22_g15131 [Coprinellus aureogranulatus]